jgi:uncharacterized protein (DUF58 family)
MESQPPPLPPPSGPLKPGVLPMPPAEPRRLLIPERRTPTPPPPTPPPLPPQQVRKRKAPPAPGRSLLNEAELDSFKNLLVFAKTAVESRFAGRHKSPDLGSGGEFAEYKQYYPGHPTGAIDWHVYGRTRRLHIRTYEELSDMAVHLVADMSGSMSYLGRGKETKGLRAARVSAALAYLMMRQGDKASLTLFADKILDHVPVGGTERHLLNMLNILIKPAMRPAGTTRIAESIRDSSLFIRKRGRLVVLSDFLGEDPGEILDALGPFIHRRFEILLLQLSDPDERTLPNAPLARFVDAESGEQLEVEPEEIRSAFEQTVRERTEELRRGCMHRRIDFAHLGTEQAFMEAIEAYLGFRRWDDLTL